MLVECFPFYLFPFKHSHFFSSLSTLLALYHLIHHTSAQFASRRLTYYGSICALLTVCVCVDEAELLQLFSHLCCGSDISTEQTCPLNDWLASELACVFINKIKMKKNMSEKARKMGKQKFECESVCVHACSLELNKLTSINTHTHTHTRNVSIGRILACARSRMHSLL